MNKATQELLDAASKKSDKKEMLIYDQEDGAALADDWLRTKGRLDVAKERADKLASSIIDLVQPWYMAQCRAAGRVPSVIIQGLAGNARVTFQEAYAKIKADKEDELRDIVGEDFDQLFRAGYSMKIRKHVAEDPKALQAIITILAKAMGQEKFVEAFEVEQTLVPLPEFTSQALGFNSQLAEELADAGVHQTVVVARCP